MTTTPGTQSTFNSASSTSSRWSVFFDDEPDDKDVLVYTIRAGYEVMSRNKLAEALQNGKSCTVRGEDIQNQVVLNAADPQKRCSRKPIPRGTSRLEIKVRDLLNEPHRTTYAHYPNQSNSIASVGLPRGVYWRNLLLGQYPELYIVSPDSSANVSKSSSYIDQSSPVEDKR